VLCPHVFPHFISVQVAVELELFQDGKVNSDGGRFKKAYEKAKKTKSAKLHDFVDIKVSMHASVHS